jgi:acyl-CoA reductase-like NAD-dependent aldehyde dehydrogenase
MEVARTAQRSWAARPLRSRLRFLRELRHQIADSRDEIIDAIVRDVAKPMLDALAGEVLVTLEQMLAYERSTREILAPRRIRKNPVLYAGCSFYEVFEPHGVALIYAPANYPFQLAMVPAMTALFAGNAVVLKVSERAVNVGRVIQKLCERSLPADVVQVLWDDPSTAARYIDAGPDVVLFTGSSEHGREIASRAGGRLIPTILELGGKDPALVFADCNLERTVEGVVYGAFSNAGQVCVGIKRLYIERSLGRRFLDALLDRVTALRVGTGADSDLGRIAAEGARQRLEAQVQDALDRGATLETPGEISAAAPMILSNVPGESRLLTEETFGPVLCVASFDTEEEAIALANRSPFALSASVWTRDLTRGRRVASAMNAGSCAINDVIRNIVNPHAAFGGNGVSGYGRYHGPEGLRAFSRVKSVMVVRPWLRRELHWFPFTRKTLRRLNRWIELRHRSRKWMTAVRRFISSV